MFKVVFLVLAIAGCTLAGYAVKHIKPTKNIVRPCHPLTNKCVGANLAANSKCSLKNLKGLPVSYEYGEFKYETPYFNSSYVEKDLVIKNHQKCFVSEFFYNLKKDLAVLTVDCPGLVFAANRTLIQHYSQKEDEVFSYSSTWKYPLIRMTVNIPRADHTELCSAYVFTDVTQLPVFIVTPNDKPTQNFLSQDLSFLNIYERELGFYRGNLLFRSFISSYICNFGCLK